MYFYWQDKIVQGLVAVLASVVPNGACEFSFSRIMCSSYSNCIPYRQLWELGAALQGTD